MKHPCLRLALTLSGVFLLPVARAPAAPPPAPSFSVVMDLKPMRAQDDTSGLVRQALVLVPVFVAEQDEVQVNDQGLCNLSATMLSGGPKIISQQWNALQVYHRDDLSRRRVMVAHGQLVLDRVAGDANQTYQIKVETTTTFPGSDRALATLASGRVMIDTGPARFTLVASGSQGFRFASANVNGSELLFDQGLNGVLSMYRRRVTQDNRVETLLSSLGAASAEIVKNGSSCAEVVVRGEMHAQEDPTGMPQRYQLLLRFHAASARVTGELLLTNWNDTLDGQPANYIIPYDGFALTLRFAHGPGQHSLVSILRDSDQLADYDLGAPGRSASALCGFKDPREFGEYEGLDEKDYWPENARSNAYSGGLDLVTKGFWLLLDGKLDPRFGALCGNPDIYPLGCAARLHVGNTDVAFMSGIHPEYAQPVGITVLQQQDAAKVDIALTDYRAPNAFAKSIPWRSAVRKGFVIEFGYTTGDTLKDLVRSEQYPYIGTYTDVASYDERIRNFTFLSDNDRNGLWRKTGFVKSGDSYQYTNPFRKDLRFPFWIGSNRTGGENNWDQQFIDFLLGLHGQSGYLMALRWNIDFHTQLGVRSFDDADFDRKPINYNQRVSTSWEVDIEHEDHKGYHLGVALFGNPLDVECLAHQAYFTLGMPGVGKTLYVRAIGNRIGRVAEEQGFLRSLLQPKKVASDSDPVEDVILDRGLGFFEDFNSRRIDPNNPCTSSGWTVDPAPLPLFLGDPEQIDFPVASWGTPWRYPWVGKTGYSKVIDAFHLVKGLASVREFMLTPEDYPAPFRSRVSSMMLDARLRLAQGGMTIAQWYAFLYPYCSNFVSACSSFKHLAPWERVLRQKKYYPACMSICDDRVMDELNNWMAYSFMDAYTEATEEYIAIGDWKSAFYMLRYGLNHLSTVRFGQGPPTPCGDPSDNKQNDFFWSSIYPGEMRLWKVLRDYGYDKLFEASYPNLFPTETKWP